MKSLVKPYGNGVGQRSTYPQATDGPSTLGAPADNVSCHLTSPMTATDVIAQVDNAAQIPVWSLITFGSELMQISSISGNTLTFGVAGTPGSLAGRGLSGTTIAAHKAGVAGYLNTNAWYHQAQSSAIVAIEGEVKNRFPSVMDWGAKGDGTTDDTAAIQAAINASTGGAVLHFPCATFCISAPLTLIDAISLIGVPGQVTDNTAYLSGTLLKWIGPSPPVAYDEGSAMVLVHGVSATKIYGFGFNGQNTANLSGYMVDTVPGSRGSNNYIDSCYFGHFGNPVTNTPGAGMNFGDLSLTGPGGQAEQIDFEDIRNFNCFDCCIGVRIKNPNFCTTKFTHFGIGQVNIGFDIEYSGYHIVEDGAFGDMEGNNPSVLYINGPHGEVTYRNIQAEADLSPGKNAQFLTITTGSNRQGSRIVFQSCLFGFPSVVADGGKNLVLIGNDFSGNTFTVSGDSGYVTAISNTCVPANIVITGANANWVNIPSFSSEYTAQVFAQNIANPNYGPVEFRMTPASGGHGFNLFTDYTGQQWIEYWSNSWYGFTAFSDVGNIYNPYLPLAIGKGLATPDGIQISHQATKINGVQYDSNSHPVHYFSTQGGVDGAITLSTPDGVWTPNFGDMLCITLSNNKLTGGVQNTISVNGSPAYGIYSSKNFGWIPTGYSPGSSQITVVFDVNYFFRDISQ